MSPRFRLSAWAMSSFNSYPKIYTLGHPCIARLRESPVVVEEKIDGSQFSFGVIDGVLRARSRGKEIYLADPEKMFGLAIDTIREIAPLMVPEWTYRGEYLQKPKHNSLAYDRVPLRNIMLFDVATGLESYGNVTLKQKEANRLGLECVPVLHDGMLESVDQVKHFLELTSVLGGPKIEGVVIKNHSSFGPDGKPLMGKFVSEDFKEVHAREWKTTSPGTKDILLQLGDTYRSEARWQKAYQHLVEAGKATDAPQDIPLLMKAIQQDISEECAAEIKEALWRWAKDHINRNAIKGLPEWYKEKLLQKQFG